MLLAAAFLVAGLFHLIRPAPFLAITPTWVPLPEAVIRWTGIAEIVGASALAQPWDEGLRRAAGWALASYCLCVYPANINHMLIDQGRPDGGLGLIYHVPRLLFQPVLIWLTLWTGRAIRARA